MVKLGNLDDLLNKDEYINYKQVEEKFLNEKKYKQMIEEHNRLFIKNKLVEYKDYFDHIYDDINPNIQLDINQRIAILTNEDYNLIIAGAGSGKTTTMIGKIKYLIEKCHVPSNEILAISFARKNVEELDEKLNKILKLNVDVKTFHSLGKSILNQNDSKKEIVSDGQINKILNSYFEEEIFKNKKDLKLLVNFLNCYLNVGSEMDNFNNLNEYHNYICEGLKETLKGDYNDYIQSVVEQRSKYRRTITSEYVRSNEELKIANFLFLNGIDYKYEEVYVVANKIDRTYHPDFTLYQGENRVFLEHFGISQNGTSSIYSVNETNKYNHNIDLKRQKHARNGTVLIETYSKYNDNRSLLTHLKEDLEKCGFVLKRRSDEEIFDVLLKTQKYNYFYKYKILAEDIIERLKLSETSVFEIDNIIKSIDSGRTKLFFETLKPLYKYYEDYLKNHEMIDFADMIVKAIKKVREKTFEYPQKYKYLIIDEYQDISKERFELIKELSESFSSHIVAVGDDWQAIFGFAGSDVSLFTHFQESLGYGEILKITNTYRNSQELIDVAGEFVQKDENNIKKNLYSNKHLDKPIVVYSYEDNVNSVIEKGKAITAAIKDIYNNNPQGTILLIGRYKDDENKLLKSSLFNKENNKIICLDCPLANIEFSSVHKSKGLEFDNIIIVNAINDTFGFPAKIKDDPIYEVFNKNYENFSYAEERRLFYVALTRTKNKVYIIVPRSKPSSFVLELKENKHVEFTDDVVEKYNESIEIMKCPKCNSPLYRRRFPKINKYVYQCSNDKELCNFKTLELKYKIPINLCPCCDGYLILKSETNNNRLLLGCTNYSMDNTGCNYTEFIDKP